MIPRRLEPEVMDTESEALDYDSMDHREVNTAFVDDLLGVVEESFGQRGDMANEISTLDCGTGTAQIPIELCRRVVVFQVTAIDLAGEMLKVARQNVANAGLTERIQLEHVDAKQLPYRDNRFDVVMSNSIVHHVPNPVEALSEMLRVVRPGGMLFVRDLLRPNDLESIDQLVSRYAGDANDHQKRMFRDSLHAALTLADVREILATLGCATDWARQTSDRHWTVVGRS